MVADVIINRVRFERFRGDGISVSTPTGSTAYNKSLGGAVLHPTIEALQVTELPVSTIGFIGHWAHLSLFPKNKIELVPTRSDYHTIAVDNQTFSFKNIVRIEYQIDNHKIHFGFAKSYQLLESCQRLLYWRVPGMRFEFIADEHVKVKTFLKRHEISKGLLAKIKFSGGNILVNHQPQNAIYLLDIGDKVTIDIPLKKD